MLRRRTAHPFSQLHQPSVKQIAKMIIYKSVFRLDVTQRSHFSNLREFIAQGVMLEYFFLNIFSPETCNHKRPSPGMGRLSIFVNMYNQLMIPTLPVWSGLLRFRVH